MYLDTNELMEQYKRQTEHRRKKATLRQTEAFKSVVEKNTTGR